MPKAKLVTRSASTSSVTTDSIPKGSGLTNVELDSNFLNLRDAGWRLRADDSTQHTITADTQINFAGGTITTDANGDITVSNLGGSGDIGDLQVTAFGTYTDETLLNPSVTDANLILAGNNNGVVAINDDLVIMSSSTNIPSYSKSTFTTNKLQYIGVNSNGNTWKYTIASGTDTSQPETTIQLLARSVLLNHNINSDIIATGGNGDLRIQNGGDAGSKGLSEVSVGHNHITLTDNNDGEIIISPKTGKWVEVNDDKIVINNTKTPTGVGAAGDKQGSISYDGTNLYVCTADYDGSTVVWKKLVLQTI